GGAHRDTKKGHQTYPVPQGDDASHIMHRIPNRFRQRFCLDWRQSNGPNRHCSLFQALPLFA
ncbi:MAG: hypothetical protein MN733_27660, partial [Nitrososphaera sp.]|nr:hypothetical protein [Nitrososphaera sp.]